MNAYRRLAETVHVTAAGVWTGVMAMTGASAAIIFPRMRDLDPSLPAYSAFEGEHWRLTAGQIASRLFLIADAVQLGCIILCGLTLGLIALSAQAWKKPLVMSARLVMLFGAIGLLTYSFAFLGPRMNTNMVTYWEAAEAGDNERALIHQAAFDEDHPTASRVMMGSFACALVLTVLGAWSAASTGSRTAASDGRESRTPKSSLETPTLAQGKRRR